MPDHHTPAASAARLVGESSEAMSSSGPSVVDVVDLREGGVARSGVAAPEVSVVMPCLNEEASIGICIQKAWAGIAETGLSGEVVIADNGSTDRSVSIALLNGAVVVHQPRRGYGNAYLCGFAAARGGIIVMGDCDDSYDFSALASLISPLRNGEFDYVLGSRFGGTMVPGAMT